MAAGVPTRSRSERLAGSSCFFFGALVRCSKWEVYVKWVYLNGTAALSVRHPGIVEVETDQAENGDVEENVPPVQESLLVIHPGSKIKQAVWRKGNQVHKCPKPVPIVDLHSHQDVEVEDPRRPRNNLSREPRCDLVVQPQKTEDFESTGSVEDGEENGTKEGIKRNALLQPCVGSSGRVFGGTSFKGCGLEEVPNSAQERLNDEQPKDVWNLASDGF